ncbi:MAG: tetratricopeptide repeat protein, partial [Pseudomonadota bacterium]
MAINKNKVMEAAQKLVEKGQFDKAIREYLKVVQEDPKDVRVWLKIGDLYAKKNAKQEATETYQKVAQFYGEQGFYLKAVAVYKQILKLDPRLVEVNMKLAELYRQLGLMSDAVQQYELVAAFYHREGRVREALATIKALCELDPDNVATRIKLAELYSKENLVEDAIAEFTKAAEYLRSHNRIDDFLKVAERLLWHQPDNYAVNREVAGLYLKRSDPRRALQRLHVCFKADPRDVETLSLLASAFQALEQKTKTVSVLKELARIHQENGENAKATDVWRRVLGLTPDDADALAVLSARPSGVFPARAPGKGPPVPPGVPSAMPGSSGIGSLGGSAAAGSVQGQAPARPSLVASASNTTGAPPVVTIRGSGAQQRPPTPVSGVPIGRDPMATSSVHGRRLATPVSGVAVQSRGAGAVGGGDTGAAGGGGGGSVAPGSAGGGGAGAGSGADGAVTDVSGLRQSRELRMDGTAGSSPSLSRGRSPAEDLQRSGVRPRQDNEATAKRGILETEAELEKAEAQSEEELFSRRNLSAEEAHADEIAKILTETDVYAKYGLHRKAIEHLSRVFELDPRSVEAREKLKDIYIALRQEPNAVAELVQLVELTGRSNPEQAASYLRELAEIDPTDRRIGSLATKYNLKTDLQSSGQRSSLSRPGAGRPGVQGSQSRTVAPVPFEVEAEVEAEAEDRESPGDDEESVEATAIGDDFVEDHISIEFAEALPDGRCPPDAADVAALSLGAAASAAAVAADPDDDQFAVQVEESSEVGFEFEFDDIASSPVGQSVPAEDFSEQALDTPLDGDDGGQAFATELYSGPTAALTLEREFR